MPRVVLKSAVIAAVCAIAPLLGGCVYQQHGARFDPGIISQLQPGISTEQDAVS
jgi:hypothetical protein